MSTIHIDRVSRWFGNVVAVNDITMDIAPGVTGLLGPNGAGKSTLIHMMGGFLSPSNGTVTLEPPPGPDGRPAAATPIWRNEDAYRHIGLVPEREGMYDFLTGEEFVLANAELHGLRDPRAAAAEALATVEMEHAQDRRISTYSKGMRQRVKMASALVHHPTVLLLDEPFNGMDPRQRMHLMELLRKMGDEGRTVLFSSHILEEVEQLASHIEVIVAGRHAASGDFRKIRRLMTDRPHRYLVRSSDDRRLAAALIADACTAGIELDRTEEALRIQAVDFTRFTTLLPRVAREHGIRLYTVSPSDESLESVFSYLVAA
ncbi:ABC transporter ATP-binding protein [Streptomyces sp. NPDC007083]|uniref:ABC transporter ATP-binding protein n=1 Tax=unclassified Streptomyces TaxID=2593676 RepID=UPI0033E77F3B